MDTLIKTMTFYHECGLISHLNARVDRPVEKHYVGPGPAIHIQPSVGDVYIEFTVEPGDTTGFIDSVYFTLRGYNPIAVLHKCEQLINAAWLSI